MENLSNSTADLLRVGLVSDTHGHLDPKAYAALAESDRIIHAGDIGDPAIIRSLEELAPVTAVLGNNDYDEYGSEVRRFAHPVIGGVRFLVAHYPQDVRIGFSGGPGIAPGDPIPQVCVHGHTHVPEIIMGKDARPADYVLCPGATFRPRGGFPRCVGHLLVGGGQVYGARIESLDGDVVFEVGDLG